MKTLQKILATILLGAACSSCDLTLIPEDTVTPQTFFKTETDLRLWTNQFYINHYLGYMKMKLDSYF